MKNIQKLSIFFIAGVGLLLGGLINGQPAQAAPFDPDYLLADSELINYNSLTVDDIQKFLNNKSGTLKSYLTFDKENQPKTATQAFYEIAQRWLVNPKYLLVLVQKEQSLIEDATPTQGQYDRATGYGCPDSGGCDDRWKGFYSQVNSAAAQTRYYLDNITEFTYQPGQTYNIDNKSVKPKTIATAALYNYTPHLHGNELFWNLWNSYFSKKWPDGSLLQSDDDSVIYLIENGRKRAIISKAVFISRFDPKNVITVSPGDLALYDDGAPIKYLNFSLLKNSASSDIFMIINDTKRKIDSAEVFRQLGFNDDDVTVVTSSAELNQYQDGSNITSYTLYPTGLLAQNDKNGKIYYIISGRKKLVLTPEIQAANFSGLKPKKLSISELDQFPSGDPVTLPDGWIIKGKKTAMIYVIADGKRLPILNPGVFTKMHYSFKNVKIVSEETVNAHVLGQTLTGD